MGKPDASPERREKKDKKEKKEKKEKRDKQTKQMKIDDTSDTKAKEAVKEKAHINANAPAPSPFSGFTWSATTTPAPSKPAVKHVASVATPPVNGLTKTSSKEKPETPKADTSKRAGTDTPQRKEKTDEKKQKEKAKEVAKTPMKETPVKEKKEEKRDNAKEPAKTPVKEKMEKPTTGKKENETPKSVHEISQQKEKKDKRAESTHRSGTTDAEKKTSKKAKAPPSAAYSAGDLSKSLFGSHAAEEKTIASMFASKNVFTPPVPAKVVLPKFIPKLKEDKDSKEQKKSKRQRDEDEEEEEEEKDSDVEDETDEVYRREGLAEQDEQSAEEAEEGEEDEENEGEENANDEDEGFDSMAVAKRMIKKYLTDEDLKVREEEEEEKAEYEQREQRRHSETPEERLARTVFVGNLPVKVKRKAVRQLFAPYGKVETVRLRSIAIAKPMERRAGVLSQQLHPQRDSCNGYVVMDTAEEARACLVLHNTVFMDKHLRVDLATQEKTNDYSRSRHSVFVGNVPFGAEDEDLRRHFASAGEVTNVRIVRDKDTLMGKGFAYVEFKDLESLEKAVELNGSKFENRELRVSYAKGKPVLSDAAKKSKGMPQSEKRKSHLKRKDITSGPSKKKHKTDRDDQGGEKKQKKKHAQENTKKTSDDSHKKKQKTSSASGSSPASFEGKHAVEGVKPQLLKLAAHAKAASMAKKLQKQKTAQQKKRKNVNRERKGKKGK